MGCMSSKEHPKYDYVHDNRTGRTEIRTRPEGYSTYQGLKRKTSRRHSTRVRPEDIQLHKQSRKPHQRRREREDREDRREERREEKAAAAAAKSRGAAYGGDGGEGPGRERRGAISGEPGDGRVAQEARRVDQREQRASASGAFFHPDERTMMSGGRGGGAGPD